MVLKIRLSRFGPRHSPIYNIVLAHARTARDSKPLEVLGTYDPKPKTPLSSNDDEPNIPQATQTLGAQLKQARTQSTLRQRQEIAADQARSQRHLSAQAPSSLPPQSQESQPEESTQPKAQGRRQYKSLSLDIDRTKYWLGVGAQPSEPMERLLSMLGLVERRPGRSKVASDVVA